MPGLLPALRSVRLPPEVSDFERQYLRRMNRVALGFFVLHVPVLVAIAVLNRTGPLLALGLTAAVLVGPLTARFTLDAPRAESMVHGITAMLMGGLLVHFGQGPTQIEMHFYFFALIAICAVFANPMVIIAAALTVVLQHLIVWIWLPRSVFNYEASAWVVGVHALFVGLESVAACFIARSFFDNVIGLERIVTARTEALNGANREMRLLLDNVQQGFLTLDRGGRLAHEHSAAIDRWFGPPPPGVLWLDYLRSIDPAFALSTRVAWTEVVEDVMPLEVTLAQMPAHLMRVGRSFQLAYQAIAEPGVARPERFLVIVTDVTNDLQREQAEVELREAMTLFERVLADRSGVESFFGEAGEIVGALQGGPPDLAIAKRLVHTLKGNAALYGLRSIEGLCQAAEDRLADTGQVGAPDFEALAHRWKRLGSDIARLLGQRSGASLLDEEQYALLLSELQGGASREQLLHRLHQLKLEPTSRRLRHFAEQAQQLAVRLDKNLVVDVVDHGLRLDREHWAGFWANFVHCVRNAVDHGIEPASERVAAGKPAAGKLTLRTYQREQELVVEVEDDGRGIDWNQVRDRAERAGLPAASPEDLQRALFADGISTAENITDLSGRGVGLGAVLQNTRALGGAVAVESRAGQGTVVRMIFPPARAGGGGTRLAAEGVR